MDFDKFLADLIAARAVMQTEWEANAASHLTEKRDMTEAELLKHNELDQRIADKDAEIAKIEKIVASRKACPTPPPQVTPPVEHEARVVSRPYRHGKLKSFKSEEDAYRSGQWLLANIYHNPASQRWCEEHGAEVRAMGGESNTAGGALVIPEFERTIVDLRQEYGLARQKCRIVPMTGDTITFPVRATGVTAYAVGENDEVTASDKSWTNVNLVARKWGVLCKYSSEIAEDAIVSMADDLASEIAYAFAVKEDESLFLGDGTSTYHGVVGLITAINAGSEYTAIGGNTAFSTLDLADFESMIGKLPAYPGIAPEWYISKAGWAASMMRLADSAGGATVSEVVSGSGNARTFLGYPVNFCQSLNSTLTAQTSTQGILYFGDLRMSTAFGSRRGITLKQSDQRYLEYDQIGILGTERFDIVNHQMGTASVPGPMLQMLTPGS